MPQNLSNDIRTCRNRYKGNYSFVVEALVALKAGRRGPLSGLETLQDGHGIPAPPQPQALSPLQGRSSCVSQTQ
jgi:hypothetical protein